MAKTKSKAIPPALRKTAVCGMCFLQWTRKKPKFDTECVLICAHQFRGNWEYSIYQIKKVIYEDKWYWGWLNGDGEEVGDLSDLRAQIYYVMPMLSGKKHLR